MKGNFFINSKIAKNGCLNEGHWLKSSVHQGFHNRTGPGGQIVKIGNRDENRFFKHKEPDFLLIL